VIDGERAKQKARTRLSPGRNSKLSSFIYESRYACLPTWSCILQKFCIAESFCIASRCSDPEKPRKNKAKKFSLDLRYGNDA
jgi:hypothetical protein